MKAMVEPLPLVPATWMTGRHCFSCELPSAPKAASQRTQIKRFAMAELRAEQSQLNASKHPFPERRERVRDRATHGDLLLRRTKVHIRSAVYEVPARAFGNG